MPRKATIGLGIFIILAALLAAGYARNLQRTEMVSPEVSREDTMAMSAAPAADSAKMAVSERSAANGAAAAAGGAAAPAAPAAPQQGLPPLSASIVDRMIVKTGALTLELGAGSAGGAGDALGAAMQRVNAVVAGIPGAYVAASSTSYRSETPLGTGPIAPTRPLPIPQPQPHTMATLTLKVPVDAFDQTMQRLREIGSPLAENVSTQEVTEEYVDLEAQVRNLEATEQQYLRFLERAQRIEEILPIQQRLTEVRSQIERIKGRMTLLQRRADVSTITVSLILPAGKGGVSPSDPRAVRTLKEAWAHLTVALSGALDLLIYVAVYALPLLPIVAAVVWWRRRQSGAAPGTPTTPATAGGAI